ncbi:MAG TPA: hypothetical protein VJS92_01705 [Candidatus Polarisedimenticolaceae bacterium]|nr:hypothetical protein [Candidatus Polarisedimenticolaceae bacterium]
MRRLLSAAGLLTGLTLALALSAATPVQAQYRDGYRDRHDRRHGHGYAPRHRHHERRDFVVPRHLGHRRHEYRRYYQGSVYFAPHRHYHTLYTFPIYGPSGYDYQRYDYCNDELYVYRHTAGRTSTSISTSERARLPA